MLNFIKSKWFVVLIEIGKRVPWRELFKLIGAAKGSGSDASQNKKAHERAERADRGEAEAREDLAEAKKKEAVREDEGKSFDEFFKETRY